MRKFIWPLSTLAALLLIYFVFIPAFSGNLVINPVIDAGFFHLRLYGLTMGLAIASAYFCARHLSWRFGISKQAVDDYTFWAVIVGFLGARIYYVGFNWSYFGQNLSEIYRIWHGGISIYGGLIAGLIFTVIYSRKKAYSFYQLFDLVALSVPLAQAVGRFGNFFNQEAFGTPTALPWKMLVNGQFVHPAFLYEAAADIIIFLILLKFIGRTRPGAIGWTYLGLYSLARFGVEAIRNDSFWIHGIRVDQVTAVSVLIISAIMLLRLKKD
ncbi:MAG: prolipoprotein diacylglyceryl transferase [Candidatus Doudnabacteria bacterium RIFCSPLOWO2_02_FULL_49_13]|uniref:Phosphatidylglycerol--prolipoprotein diacylglyceryl transferase n=1 Tax=Candidatus Doudnabacteria bacterium RIFCSPHIGHO2_12_FULL_48_16 TaxID=1817838 RepID=A0A1F5PLF3_9BACT|nr:MAG: prolipoprotein diacylglyceryl transferase [Candidatus Doudnabacteria bacterium RIFCSPHIGHO2_02_FULL_49_24]OGE88846.1 MAG: prolipoprotein diacylglyceryl transferase [Candidatus Doudnabacteria bacterium RIFCSPHIGHO2_01_FULL_50_67]OGE90634.1 MAG: prolipoprotein diacylglyceryl transferase [Candidatus Doudnabacteria bacterium RIFCSPHIGHO2_12_FULL_48_16]OGE96965.1 MAG: prolipoprotein diacylglyceryl transferase [Candidatus Doudnabacteria bacterium RIFCSPLOWO2_01_FULL_49_40]OGF02466.1 MAG: prol